MADLRSAVASILAADNQLLTDLEGGVWTRPLIKPPDRAATPEAFDGRTGRVGALLPAAVVQVSGVGQSFSGTSLVSSLSGVKLGASRAVTVWLYQQRPDRDAIERAKFRVIALLNEQSIPTDNEGQVWLKFVGDLGDGPIDEDLNAEVDNVRFNAATMIGRR